MHAEHKLWVTNCASLCVQKGAICARYGYNKQINSDWNQKG